MSARLLAALALLALVGALLALGGVPGTQPVRPASPPARAAAKSPPPASTVRPKGPSRNLFDYGKEPPAPTMPQAPVPRKVVETPEPVAAAPALPVRLVGIVTREGRLQAALARAGEVAVLGPGDELAGYTVVSVEEDGVRLRDPQGTELLLTTPEIE